MRSCFCVAPNSTLYGQDIFKCGTWLWLCPNMYCLMLPFAIYAAGPSQHGADTMQTYSQEVKPIPKPRKCHSHLQESCPEQGSLEPVRVPVQETCNPAQTLTSYLNRADVISANRQQGILLVDRRGKPRRQAISGTHSQSAPASPSLERDSGQHTSHFKPG